MSQSQQQFPVEVSATFIFFFYGASAHFRAMASPISLLQPCLFLAAAVASLYQCKTKVELFKEKLRKTLRCGAFGACN
jgi:ABC-type transport system involved in cytochrome c biogenesis permease subunit